MSHRYTLKDLASRVMEEALELLDGSDLSEVSLHFGDQGVTSVMPTPVGVVVYQVSKDSEHQLVQEVTITDEIFERIVKARAERKASPPKAKHVEEGPTLGEGELEPEEKRRRDHLRSLGAEVDAKGLTPARN